MEDDYMRQEDKVQLQLLVLDFRKLKIIKNVAFHKNINVV